MTRLLDFTDDKGPKRFELLRLALLAGGDGKGERVRDTIRKEARLLDALDLISVPAPLAGDADRRVLQTGAAMVPIGQDDFDLLNKYVDTTPWVPRVSRDAVDLQDWLSASEKKE